jgi:hypothetical protein
MMDTNAQDKNKPDNAFWTVAFHNGNGRIFYLVLFILTFVLLHPMIAFTKCVPAIGGGEYCTTQGEASDACNAYLTSHNFGDCSAQCIDYGTAIEAIEFQNSQGTCCFNRYQQSCWLGGWGYTTGCSVLFDPCCGKPYDPCCGSKDPCCGSCDECCEASKGGNGTGNSGGGR